ncbi:MAG: LuxR C-terminal-related transcriptional regulator [Lachnospiraceae bacterium]|nr:LuxR C-terminal-related transcriptional regulator [Lachnospiraceae bacterium]
MPKAEYRIEDSHYLCPEEAKKKMNAAQKLNLPAYLYGVAGTGKTAFIRYFLGEKGYDYYSAPEMDPDQIPIPPTGERRTIVLDDLYAVTDPRLQADYAQKIRQLLRQRFVWLILVSRSRMPRWLLPIQMQNEFCVIPEESFLLTRDQQALYLETSGVSLSEEEAERVWRQSRGHAFSLFMLALEGGNIPRAEKRGMDFLETCVFDLWDRDIQDFFMETSIVKAFTAELAAMITGNSHVRDVIYRAEETGNFFVQSGEEGLWECRWEMRESFRLRLERRRTPEQIRILYHNAGLYYELYEQIPDALEMYKSCREVESISRLLIANARKNPASGHYFEMRKYYLELPEELIEKSPELMAGMSMLQSMLMNDEESERWYHLLEEYGKTATGSAARDVKSRLLYLDIGLPHRGSIHMVKLIRQASALLMTRSITLPEFSVTSNLPSLMNGGKDFCDWSRYDRELAAGIGRLVELVLGKYGKGLVSIALSESLFEKGGDSYEILSLAEKGRMQADAGGKPELIFVAAGILSWLAVFDGRPMEAWETMETFEARAREEAPKLLLNIETLKTRYLLYEGAPFKVAEWMEGAPDENSEFCTMERFRYLTKARIYIQHRKYQAAYGLLRQLLYYAEKQKRTWIRMEAELLLAIVEFRTQEGNWKETLQTCVSEAEEYRFVRLLSREGAAVYKLLKEESLIWKDGDFKARVLKECRKMANRYPDYLNLRASEDTQISERGLSILRLQAKGYSEKQIAESLGISISTVKYHNQENYRKLGVKNRSSAIDEARKKKLI